MSAWFTLQPWRWWRYVPQKRRGPSELHGITTRINTLLTDTAVKPLKSNNRYPRNSPAQTFRLYSQKPTAGLCPKLDECSLHSVLLSSYSGIQNRKTYFLHVRSLLQRCGTLSRVETVLTMAYNTQNYCPLSGILKTRKHNVSETGSVSVLRWWGDTHSVGSLKKN
jgi:hypothetical protein